MPVTPKTFRLDLAYDGTNFIGWQRQAEGRSVEGCLADSIQAVTQHVPSIHTAGRTDAGVHAEQQVVRLAIETRLDARELLSALNAVAPRDISVSAVTPVNPAWNPRRDAIERTYYYAILNRPARSALIGPRVYHARDPLDDTAMQRAAAYLVGRHDFTSFRSVHCDAENPVRTITCFEVVRDRDLIYLLVQGHAFLRKMVRIMTGTLMEVGRGQRAPDSIPETLAARNRERAGPTLDAKGLTLARIRYEGDPPFTTADLPRWIP